VVAAGVKLPRGTEAELAAFVDSLEAACAEAKREGWRSIDELMGEADRIIAAKRDAA